MNDKDHTEAEKRALERAFENCSQPIIGGAINGGRNDLAVQYLRELNAIKKSAAAPEPSVTL